jgi:hypothetical protein
MAVISGGCDIVSSYNYIAVPPEHLEYRGGPAHPAPGALHQGNQLDFYAFQLSSSLKISTSSLRHTSISALDPLTNKLYSSNPQTILDLTHFKKERFTLYNFYSHCISKRTLLLHTFTVCT